VDANHCIVVGRKLSRKLELCAGTADALKHYGFSQKVSKIQEAEL
jgi:hypothetical protein